MKKVILVILFGLMLSASPSYAVGSNLLPVREVRIATREAKITQIQVNISEDLRNRAAKEITRRVSFLTELITQINGIKKLTTPQKTDLQTQIQNTDRWFKRFANKINADTDDVTLKVDVKSIVNNYISSYSLGKKLIYWWLLIEFR